MKNLAILTIYLLTIKVSNAQRWSSAFVGKPESRALYASNVAKAIQNAWENELSSKEKKEMLLDEIIFGQESEIKNIKSNEVAKPITGNIDEIAEALGIKEEPKIDPVKKKKAEAPATVTPVQKIVFNESSNVTSMGNVDEVKEALESQNFKVVETKSSSSSNKKTALKIDIDDVESDSVYAIPQVNPMFPGGNNAMKAFFSKNIITPDADGTVVKGKVFVRFMVKKNGELSKIYLVKGLTEACNKEAIRVIKKMPSWIPAMQEGEQVSSWHTLPIYFHIDE